MSILIFDTETTGLPKNWKAPIEDIDNWPRMVQLAYRIYDDDGQLREEKSMIIKPEGYDIPKEASAVHGITTEKALNDGKELHDVLAEFSTHLKDADLLVAHNIDFDRCIIGAEFIRKDIEHNLDAIDMLCTMKKTTRLLKIPRNWGYGYKWPTLSELHTFLFNEDFDGAHDAGADVAATSRCLFELKKRGDI